METPVSMIERVARAIARTQSGTLFREECTAVQLDAFGYVAAARAAIEAMKDPPFDILGAMFEAMFEDKWNGSQAPMIGAGWDAGIDAALTGG